jgi:hypothetical protein
MTLNRIRIIYNYLPEFERIRSGDCKRPLIELTWPNKNWATQLLIRLGGSHKWFFIITCLNSLKFEQIIVDDTDPLNKT